MKSVVSRRSYEDRMNFNDIRFKINAKPSILVDEADEESDNEFSSESENNSEV